MKETVYDHLYLFWIILRFDQPPISREISVLTTSFLRASSVTSHMAYLPPLVLKSYPSCSKKHFPPLTLWIPKPFVPFVPWLPSINDKIHMFPKSPGKWLNFNRVHPPNISGKVLSWRLPWPTCGRSPQGVHVDPENTDTTAMGWLKEQKGLKLEVAGKNMDPNDERFKYFKILICWYFPGSLIQRIHHILNHLRGWDQQLMSARSGRGFPFFWTCFSPELPGNRRIFTDKPLRKDVRLEVRIKG